MYLKIHVNLGNDACQDSYDLAGILRDAAACLEDMPADAPWSRPVRDANGATVGMMSLIESDEPASPGRRSMLDTTAADVMRNAGDRTQG